MKTTAEQAGRGMTILIVEDIDTMAQYLARILEPLRAEFPGSTIAIVDNLEDAITRVLQSPPPEIILLDVTLPPLSYRETLSQLHRFQDRCPIVIVTGHPSSLITPLLGGRQIEVLSKDDVVKDKSLLFRMMRSAVEGFCGAERCREEYRESFRLIEELRRLVDGPRPT